MTVVPHLGFVPTWGDYAAQAQAKKAAQAGQVMSDGTKVPVWAVNKDACTRAMASMPAAALTQEAAAALRKEALRARDALAHGTGITKAKAPDIMNQIAAAEQLASCIEAQAGAPREVVGDAKPVPTYMYVAGGIALLFIVKKFLL